MRQPSRRELFQLFGTQLEEFGRKIQENREKQYAKARAAGKNASPEKPRAPIAFDTFLEQSRAKLASMRGRSATSTDSQAPKPAAPKQEPGVKITFDPKTRARAQEGRERSRPHRRHRITLDRNFETTANWHDPTPQHAASAAPPTAPAESGLAVAVNDSSKAPDALPDPPTGQSEPEVTIVNDGGPQPPADEQAVTGNPQPPAHLVTDGSAATATSRPRVERTDSAVDRSATMLPGEAHALARIEKMMSEQSDQLLEIKRSIAELRDDLRKVQEKLEGERPLVSHYVDESHSVVTEPVPDCRSCEARSTTAAKCDEEHEGEIQVERAASGVLLRLPPPQALLKRLDAIEQKLSWVMEAQTGKRLRLVDARAGPESESARAPPELDVNTP